MPLDRRDFLHATGAATALALGGRPARAFGKSGKRPNILMIMTDQQQGFASYPKGLLAKLPGHSALLERGISFPNYNIHTTPCGPSRSTIFQARHIQQTGVYLNADTPPHPVAADDMPTLGHMLRAAGYYTCYKGKWHLSQINRDRNWNRAPDGIYPSTSGVMERYGFNDYGFDGEPIGLTWDGYKTDREIAADTARNILDYGKGMKTDGKPWFQVACFVNPHDIMFYDATGHQADSRPDPDLLGPLRREPGDPIYAENLGFPLPESFYKDDLSTKPEAHMAARLRNDAFYGKMPLDDEASWLRFVNYYYNCIRDVDRSISQLLWALKASGQQDNTIILFTSDHGERGGGHGLRQKGATMYREEINVPMVIVHPDVAGGRETQGLMGPIDIAPTLMALAGMSRKQANKLFPGLPGVDVSELLAAPGARTERDRRGHLFDYAAAYGWAPKPGQSPKNLVLGDGNYGEVYDLSKRRLHRGAFDGRFKFARYFAPAHHHTPKDWATLSRLNDLELYDTGKDFGELTNLAYDPAYRDTVLRLNRMTNDLIAREIGRDDGSMYPGPTSLYNQPA